MRRPLFYYLAGVASVVIAFIVLWSFGLLANTVLDGMFGFGGGGSDVRVVNNVASPDGEYVATTYVGMGGGAAGWCFKRITINRKNAPFSWEKEKERGGYSFSISCVSEIELKWEGNRNLFVAYTGSANEDGISLYQRPLSEDRAVRIRYQAR